MRTRAKQTKTNGHAQYGSEYDPTVRYRTDGQTTTSKTKLDDIQTTTVS